MMIFLLVYSIPPSLICTFDLGDLDVPPAVGVDGGVELKVDGAHVALTVANLHID